MTAPFAEQVAGYLADCARNARLLSPAYHPTADGAVKVIWHRGADEADQIRATFREAAGDLPESPRPARIRAADRPSSTLDDA